MPDKPSPHAGTTAPRASTTIPQRLLSRRLLARAAVVGGAAAAVPLLGDDAAQAATGSWNLSGNSGIDSTGGANGNFLGTKDNHSLIFRTNNREWMRIVPTGLVGLNVQTPTAGLHVRRSGGAPALVDYNGTATASALTGTSSSAAGATGLRGQITSTSANANSAGVVGTSLGSGTGVVGSGFKGVSGTSAANGGSGVSGVTSGTGTSTCGVYALSTGPTTNALKAEVTGGDVSYAVWAVADANSYAGIFQGRVNIYGNAYVSGTLSKAAGSFKIDHPLDPANKYLQHSFVESPDMLNVYSGLVKLGPDGRAVVTLPSYFDALNTSVRYQLTAVGGAMPDLHVAVAYASGRFTVGGGTPGLQVSWQVTGVRKDAYAVAHPIVTELDKPADERGTFAHAAELGKPSNTQQTSMR